MNWNKFIEQKKNPQLPICLKQQFPQKIFLHFFPFALKNIDNTKDNWSFNASYNSIAISQLLSVYNKIAVVYRI